MSLRAAALALSVCLVLPGCITRISGGSASTGAVTEADAGPFPENYEEITRRWVAQNVRVIATMREFSATRPIPGAADQGILFGVGEVKGWQTMVDAEGLDAIGMTTGHITYNLLLRDGQVVAQQKLLR